MVTVEDVRVLHSRTATGASPRRAAVPGEGPVTQITDFGGLAVAFDDRVLRPRSWTVLQSDWARELLPTLPAGDVLELCAGVGHIGLRAVLGSDRRLLMVDMNEVACRYAGLNAQHARLSRQVDIRCGAMERCLDAEERFALVIADPPWVPSSSCDQHPGDPLHAIDGGADGLDLVRSALRATAAHLLPWGAALLQVAGIDQVRAVEREVEADARLELEVVGQRLGEGGAVVHLCRRSL
jgi:methylase of polypeptide subunit release factors